MNINKIIKTKITWIIIATFIMGIFIGSMFTSGDGQHEHVTGEIAEVTEWTCSMHPQIRQPEPGKCPICAMELIPVESGEQGDGNAPVLTLSSIAQALADIQTATVERAVPEQQVRLFGNIAIDENRRATISAWFSGRIEEQYVSATGSQVKKGEMLAKLYSPELYAAQQEYISIQKSSDARLPLETARKKLELLGMTDAQIDKLDASGKPSEYIQLTSPANGIVLMTGAVTGDYVKTGAVLYRIAGLDQVWVKLEAFESDINLIQTGQQFTLTSPSYPGMAASGKINFIEPVFDDGQLTATVRASINNNKGLFLPGMTVTATVKSVRDDWREQPPLLIPVSAPLITGKRAVVYVADKHEPGRFQGREIVLGPRVGNKYIVESGLKAGENVVTNGNFKIDSALQIQGKPGMMNPGVHPVSAMQHDHDHADTQMEKSDLQSSHKSHDTVNINSDKLDQIYQAYFEIHKVLTQDNYQLTMAPAKNMLKILEELKSDAPVITGLETAAKSLTQAKDLAQARTVFEPMSMNMLTLAESGTAPDNLNLYRVNCPMAFDFKGADWLQTQRDVENPYFGSEMFSCGSVEEVIQEKDGEEK